MYFEYEINQLIDGKCLRCANFLSRPQKTCSICDLHSPCRRTHVRVFAYLYNTKCGGRHRIRKVTTGRADGTNDRHTALTFWIAQTFHFAGTFVEGRQTCG